MTPSLRHGLAATVLLLALAGCGDDAEPSASSETPTPPTASSSSTEPASPSTSATSATPVPPAGPSLDVTISGDEVKPVAKQVRAKAGDVLLVTITSDRTGELHVHSSPEQEVGFKPGTTEVEVELEKPGQVDIEEHESGALIARVLVK
jgi:hypothetical protein